MATPDDAIATAGGLAGIGCNRPVLMALPSSQPSPGSRLPLPHPSSSQAAEQPSLVGAVAIIAFFGRGQGSVATLGNDADAGLAFAVVIGGR